MAKSLFKYHLRISPRSRSIRFHITTQRGLEVVIPQGYDPSHVPGLLKRKQRWVRTALEQAESQRALYRSEINELPTQIHLPAVGMAWAVTLKPADSATRTTVRETGAGQILISGDIGAYRVALTRWLMRQAHLHLVPRLERISRELGLTHKRVLIKRQKTRWGSCSRNGTISLNAKLLFLPPDTVNYVMIHELCHRVELNHSPRFWRLVERHCPEYRKIHAQRCDLWKAIPCWADEMDYF